MGITHFLSIFSASIISLIFSTVSFSSSLSINFENSGSKTAQRAFEEGMNFLYQFDYVEAKKSFVQAEKLDPNFGLAYWGEAMTFNHPIWLEQNTSAGRAVLDRFSSEVLKSKFPTDREKAYLHAVEALYKGAKKPERDVAFSEAMATLVEKYPSDLEAKAIYAAALLSVDAGNRNHSTLMKVARISLDVLEKKPSHPGALSPLIFSLGDPLHASLGLATARQMEKRLKSSQFESQAIEMHMPSHIYGPLGLWKELVWINQKSWELGEKRVQKKHLDAEERNYHALAWLFHAYLELGQYQKADALLDVFYQDVRNFGNLTARRYLVHLRAIRMSIRSDVNAFDLISVKAEDLQISLVGCEVYAQVLS